MSHRSKKTRESRRGAKCPEHGRNRNTEWHVPDVLLVRVKESSLRAER